MCYLFYTGLDVKMQLGMLYVIFEDILKCVKLTQIYVSKLHTYHGLCTERAQLATVLYTKMAHVNLLT